MWVPFIIEYYLWLFAFVQKVLEDISDRGIKDETVMIKIGNVPTQYKNKYAFDLIQQLANNYNFTIIRVYGPGDHVKGLIDSISSFGCKSILRRDIGNDVWFSISEETPDYLALRGDNTMRNTVISLSELESTQTNKFSGYEIKGCMIMHLLVFKPDTKFVLARELFYSFFYFFRMRLYLNISANLAILH